MKIIGVIAISMASLGNVNAQNYFAGGGGTGTGATGSALTGVGWFNQEVGTTGSGNTSVGNSSLRVVTSGGGNTTLGFQPLFSLTTGSYNTVIGTAAAVNMTSANYNTAVGASALTHSTASSNDAFGYQALFSNSSGGNNVGIGISSLYGNTTGKANVAVGQQALYTNTTSSFNCAVGQQALYMTAGVNGSTAMGYQAAYNASSKIGTNDAFGYQAMFNTTEGDQNVAIGYSALYNNTRTSDNTAVGYEALYNYNNDGGSNDAFGAYALFNNIIGVSNVAVGLYSTYSGATAGNTAVGQYSLYHGGNLYNTGIGYQSLYNNGSGSYNVALGSNTGALYTYTNCSFLGTGAEALSSTLGVTNATALGYSAIAQANNTIMLGNSTQTVIDAYASGLTYISDQRVKKDVKEDVHGLDFIKKLRPVTYHYDMQTLDKFIYGDKAGEYEKNMGEAVDASGKVLHTGFIAQEVAATAKKVGYEFSGVKVPESDKSLYGINYTEFIVPMVKGMQEQQGMIEAQAETIKNLSQTAAQQQDALGAVLAKMEVMASQLNDIKECCSNNGSTTSGSPQSLSAAQLFNAVPNPTSGSTVIYYYVPSAAKSASIQVSDVNGQAVNTIQITAMGYSSVPLQVSNLNNSIYNYSLVVDGKIIDSKKLSVILK